MTTLGSLKAGDEFRMWTRGPMLHVVENKGDVVVIQRGDVEMTRQELPAAHDVVVEADRDLSGDPTSQLNAALQASPFKNMRDMRVLPSGASCTCDDHKDMDRCPVHGKE